MHELFDLTGKVAIVTGSTRGLGKSMAKGLAQAGAAVVINGRTAEACAVTAAEIAALSGRETLPLACDVGDWDQITEFVDQVYDHFGKLDILVNNAGVNNPDLGSSPIPVTQITSEVFDRLFAINLKGPIRLAALVAPRMGAAGGGVIINVTSFGAYRGGMGLGLYGASKAGLHMFTKVMAEEWAGMNVRVNTIAPGPFMTDMMTDADRNLMPGFSEISAAATLQKRVAHPDEIIGTVLYFASNASSFVTGEDLKVTGGMF
jgi:NAD(P)-dependent dehydrogenase (short-subunit alcohol dehydrogenase family)